MRCGIRNGGKGAVRLPKIPVLTCMPNLAVRLSHGWIRAKGPTGLYAKKKASRGGSSPHPQSPHPPSQVGVGDAGSEPSHGPVACMPDMEANLLRFNKQKLINDIYDKEST